IASLHVRLRLLSPGSFGPARPDTAPEERFQIIGWHTRPQDTRGRRGRPRLTRPSRWEKGDSLVRRPQWIPRRIDAPGILLAALPGALALAVMKLLPPSPFLSDVLVALLLGALIINTKLRSPLGLARPTAEREPDRYAAGLRFTGKWLLRASIILMGFKVRTQDFGLAQFALIAGVAAASLPSAFYITHAASRLFGVRRPTPDLVPPP